MVALSFHWHWVFGVKGFKSSSYSVRRRGRVTSVQGLTWPSKCRIRASSRQRRGGYIAKPTTFHCQSRISKLLRNSRFRASLVVFTPPVFATQYSSLCVKLSLLHRSKSKTTTPVFIVATSMSPTSSRIVVSISSSSFKYSERQVI